MTVRWVVAGQRQAPFLSIGAPIKTTEFSPSTDKALGEFYLAEDATLGRVLEKLLLENCFSKTA